ncbi:hypothetical protein Tco_0619582 [Tanacetum coccineum]
MKVMAAPVISISSDSSDESVGSVMPRVILFSTILTDIPAITADFPIASDVRAAAVTSPAGVLELESHSSPETIAVLPERHVSSATYNAMVGRWRGRVMSRLSAPSESSSFFASSTEIPIVSPLPAPSTFVIPATDIISPINAPPRFSQPPAVLTARKRVGPLPSHRLALRCTSHHSSSNEFTSDSLPDSPLDSSSDSSSDHSLSDHSLLDHSLEDSIEVDIDTGLDVEPSKEDLPNLVSADRSLEVMRLGLDVAMQQFVIASAERASLSSRVTVMERSNTRLRETFRMESVRADRLRRRLSFVEDELRLIRRSRYYERTRQIVELLGSSITNNLTVCYVLCLKHDYHSLRYAPVAIKEIIAQRVTEALAAQEENHAARLEAESQSQNEDEGTNNNVARVCTYNDFLNCQPRSFSGTEGIIDLARWFEKMESVFRISNCPLDSQVKFATCTLLDGALTWWNSHVQAIGIDEAYEMPWKDLIKFMIEVPPSSDYIPGPEEQPLPAAAASPTADSPGYIPESDPEEEPEEDYEDPEEEGSSWTTC